jgi:hypothetical protein
MSDSAPNPHRTPSEVARACLDAHSAENWPKLRTLLHPDALIATFAGGGRPENPERALTRLRDAHRDFVYHADVAQMVELDDQAVLLHGRVQYRGARDGVVDVERWWLYVVRDGLLYRSAVYESDDEARTEYGSDGPTLGVT